MDKNQLLGRLREGKLTRRDFTRTLAAAGVGIAALPLTGRTARAAADLTVYGWGGYDVPELFPSFMEKHGEMPNYPLFGSEEEALQKLRSGFQADIVHPCSYNVKRWREAEVLKPIDTSRLSNYADIWPKFKEIPQTVVDGETWFVPFDCGNASILYRSDLVDPEDVAEPSWGLLFNEKYKGRLAMYNTDTTLIEIAARVLGMENYTSLSDEQLEEIRPMLEKQRDLMRFYWDDATTMEQAMASGELVAAYAWNGSVKSLREQGLQVEYMVPKEGILTWVCGLVLSSSPIGDEQAAYDFIDAMISPEAGEFLIAEQGYGHSNQKSYERVPQDVLVSLGFDNPEEKFALASVSDEADEPYRSKYIALVEEVKAGVN